MLGDAAISGAGPLIRLAGIIFGPDAIFMILTLVLFVPLVLLEFGVLWRLNLRPIGWTLLHALGMHFLSTLVVLLFFQWVGPKLGGQYPNYGVTPGRLPLPHNL